LSLTRMRNVQNFLMHVGWTEGRQSLPVQRAPVWTLWICPSTWWMVAMESPEPTEMRRARMEANTRKTLVPRGREGRAAGVEPEGAFAISLDQSVQAGRNVEGGWWTTSCGVL